MIACGIDLGGTKIECILLEIKETNFEVICRKRLPTESHLGYEHIILQIKKLILEVQSETKLLICQIGIATPGIIDKEKNVLKNANVVCLNGKNLQLDLSKSLQIPVVHANDANCFALAETHFGAGKKLTNPPILSFGVILGTGVGGGIVCNGKLFEGQHGIAGEWGHNFLVEDEKKCYCGRKGCIENIISGVALEHYYKRLSNKDLKLSEIYQLYKQNADDLAIQTIERLLFYFGKSISQVINVLDPDLIVIGGGVSNMDILYENPNKYILPFLFNDTFHTPILKHELGDSAGVIGAAFLTTEILIHE